MKLNAVETLLVNNPLRDRLLRQTADWLWRAAGAPAPPTRVLEIGCGFGHGVREIARRFRPRHIDAFDLDEKQIARARARLATADLGGAELRLWQGDAERIDAPDRSYDAVFEFAIFHHIPGWQRALSEVRRVLRPGGLFLFEELSRETFFEAPIAGALLRHLTVHPYATMFRRDEFKRGLTEAGLTERVFLARRVPGWCFGVAARPDP